MKKFFITTPIYYANDKPHIGHAYTTVAADVLARFHRAAGEDVFLLTGTDEHGFKIQKKSEEVGKDPQKFVDEISKNFQNLWDKLNVKYDNFIRTTAENHKQTVQKVLQMLYDCGAIYKGEYEGLYCVGCEQFRSENELINGRCPDHDTVLEKVREECYLLNMGELQSELIEKVEKNEFRIWPERYKKEILFFLKNEKLKDISISRKNVSWGISLPFEPEQTTYVWVDAFLNYLTGIGWRGDLQNLPNQWPVDVQLIGKDILRVHATIWPSILLHLGISLPKMLFVHGHILSGGRKMSKTIGNVISVDEMLEKFGVDGTRYLLMSAGTFGEDVDVTMKRITDKYNADLANGLGNLVSRVVKMLPEEFELEVCEKKEIPTDWKRFFENFELSQALEEIWKIVRENDRFIENNKPWDLKKTNKFKFKEVMEKLSSDLCLISELLVPFMPETAKRIKELIRTKKVEVLFPRVK